MKIGCQENRETHSLAKEHEEKTPKSKNTEQKDTEKTIFLNENCSEFLVLKRKVNHTLIGICVCFTIFCVCLFSSSFLVFWFVSIFHLFVMNSLLFFVVWILNAHSKLRISEKTYLLLSLHGVLHYFLSFIQGKTELRIFGFIALWAFDAFVCKFLLSTEINR